MMGFWNPVCPVKTDNEKVLATRYVRKDRTLVSIASWAEKPVECGLHIDWKAIGLQPDKAKLSIPYVYNFQEGFDMPASGRIPVDLGKGLLMIIGE